MQKRGSAGLLKDIPIILSKEEGLFSSTLLISLQREAKDLPIERISGRFISMLFEGKYSETPKWIKAMQEHCQKQGKEIKELLFWYITCPKCAKKYGAAQTVIFARI